MPRAGQAFPIDDKWRAAVEDELRRRGMRRAELARVSGIGRSTITAILNGTTKQSPLVPDIHEALGWPAPNAPLPSKDGPELDYIYERLDEKGRAMLLERARTIFGKDELKR